MENILSEYDKSPGIISPNFEKMDLHLPKRAVFAFLGEKRIKRFVLARGGEKAGTFVSLTKDFPLWMIKADKEELCVLQAPAGASAAVLLLERLYAYGVEKVVALGCCGALEKLAENVFFVVRKALRDEGTSYHYLPPSRFVTLDESAADIVEGVLRENHVSCESCVAWSTDGFFRETKEKVKARRNERKGKSAAGGRLPRRGYGMRRLGGMCGIQGEGICPDPFYCRYTSRFISRTAGVGKRKPR